MESTANSRGSAAQSDGDLVDREAFIDIQRLEYCDIDPDPRPVHGDAHAGACEPHSPSVNVQSFRQSGIARRESGYDASGGLRSSQGRTDSSWAARRKSVASSP